MNDQNLGTTLFTYARKGRKSLFCFSTHEEAEVMAVCSHDAEMVIHNQSVFMDFVFVCGEAKW